MIEHSPGEDVFALALGLFIAWITWGGSDS